MGAGSKAKVKGPFHVGSSSKILVSQGNRSKVPLPNGVRSKVPQLSGDRPKADLLALVPDHGLESHIRLLFLLSLSLPQLWE